MPTRTTNSDAGSAESNAPRRSQSRERGSRQGRDELPGRGQPRTRRNGNAENEIRVGERARPESHENAQGRARKRKGASAARQAAGADSAAIPADVRKQFVQSGNKYFFPDGAPAFTDRGTKLTTQSENAEVIRSLVAIAAARGWREITVHGTERFRKEAWFAANLAGVDVQGYRPTEFEQARLIRRIGPQRAEASPGEAKTSAQPNNRRSAGKPEQRKSAEEKPPRVRTGALITGRLIDHGHAHYRHDPQKAASYFVRLETRDGEREIWGVDLERALRESLTRPREGDFVGLRAVGRERVTVRSRAESASGQVESKDKSAHRNRWIVEGQEFFSNRAQAARVFRDEKIEPREAVQRYPELAGSYLQLRAAELTAKRMRDAEDQRRFFAMVRGSLADSIARGEPLTPVRVRERSAARGASIPRRPQERELVTVRG